MFKIIYRVKILGYLIIKFISFGKKVLFSNVFTNY